MATTYKLDPQAEEELVLAMAWYDAEREGLGFEFLEAFHDVAQHATRHPEAGTVIEGSPVDVPIRRFLFERFPYALFTLWQAPAVLIFAVAHQHQRPGYWIKRLAKTVR